MPSIRDRLESKRETLETHLQEVAAKAVAIALASDSQAEEIFEREFKELLSERLPREEFPNLGELEIEVFDGSALSNENAKRFPEQPEKNVKSGTTQAPIRVNWSVEGRQQKPVVEILLPASFSAMAFEMSSRVLDGKSLQFETESEGEVSSIPLCCPTASAALPDFDNERLS